MLKFVITLFFLSGFLFANTTEENTPGYDLLLAPQPYSIDLKTKVVPVDILNNSVAWNVAKNLKNTNATALLNFKVGMKGYPFLMLNPNSIVKLNGKKIKKVKLSAEPFKKSNYYYLAKELKPNVVYTLELSYSFKSDRKNSHFLPLQYYKHSFVESGIPCNGHQDHFLLSLKINLLGGSSNYTVFTNGDKEISEEGIHKIVFPKEFTSASFYIDIDFKGNTLSKEVKLVSIDKREIPLLVYTQKGDADMEWVESFTKALTYTFTKLEDRFGSYPYKKIIFNVTDRAGGGAYAGAMALPKFYIEHVTHELGHSWFSHSVSPASGNDYWIFEGLGNWAPIYRTGALELNKNYEAFVNLTENQYDLWKPDWGTFDAHRDGSAILASIDKKIRISEGPFKGKGLIPVLKEIHKRKKGMTMSTDQFRQLLNIITEINFDPVFGYYLNGSDIQVLD